MLSVPLGQGLLFPSSANCVQPRTASATDSIAYVKEENTAMEAWEKNWAKKEYLGNKWATAAAFGVDHTPWLGECCSFCWPLNWLTGYIKTNRQRSCVTILIYCNILHILNISQCLVNVQQSQEKIKRVHLWFWPPWNTTDQKQKKVSDRYWKASLDDAVTTTKIVWK